MLSKYTLIILTVFTAWTSSTTLAQDPTDLYLFQLHRADDYNYHIYGAKFLSGFNPDGYTNQPWFTSTGDLLVSVRKVGGEQNDIYQLSLTSRKIKRLTQTKANEYSPRIHPDGKQLTVVRQLQGDSINQQIFQSALQGGGYRSLTPQIKDIGYYTWTGKDQLALFRIDGEANHLVSLNLSDGRTRRITSSIGRTLLSDGAGSIVYVHKFAEDYWYLKKYNPASLIIDIILQTPGKSEDFALAPDGTYFMGVGSKLYCFHPAHHLSWQEVGDVSVHGITQISRLAVSPDGKQLALVSIK
ncbi:MAG: hypothetical protein SH808_12480 [Saprospiraceae bacterium]|nr:hypothetical protein [Saprospiraceae bacterium]